MVTKIVYGRVAVFRWECLRSDALQPTLKAFNGILGSLAEVFSAAHVLKEFKEMVEGAVDLFDQMETLAEDGPKLEVKCKPCLKRVMR